MSRRPWVEERLARTKSLALAWLANVPLAAATGAAWLRFAPPDAAPSTSAWLALALVSSAAVLAAVPGMLLVAFAWVAPSRRALGPVQSFVWTLFQLLLYSDTVIYARFRYHYNGLVLNVLSTSAGRATLEVGWGTWGVVALVGVALFALQWWAWRRWFERVPALAAASVEARRWRLARNFALGALALAFVGEKAAYAAADLTRARRITALAQLFPMYHRITVKRLAHKTLGWRLDERKAVEIGDEGLFLRYPLEAPVVERRERMPNVLLLVIDSLRADVLDAQTMPQVDRFASSGRRFLDHASGGNATRYGIFSLVYGIHGSYWRPVYAEQAPPVLVTTLQGLGYDLRVLSGASMSFPEFRSTAWVSIEDRVEDDLPQATKWQRDEEVARRFDAWLDERAARGARDPFFCFALLDSPHGNYSWPRERTAFRPHAERVDVVALATGATEEDVELVWNSYRNAVLHADAVAGGMLASLARHGVLEDTIVVVTGDHGEEFFENGYFGHTSNFTREQVHVAFAMAGPGVPPGVEGRPTAHVDVAPTLLELLGADPAVRTRWSQGMSLLAPPERRERVVASWNEVAVWLEDGVLRVPLEGSEGLVQGYRYDWREPEDEDALIDSGGAAIARLALEARAFLR